MSHPGDPSESRRRLRRFHRPVSASLDDLGFRRRSMVRWLAPAGLASTGARVLMSGALARYVDKREVEAALPCGVSDYSDEDELWIDFVADTGDGFDSTYSVAWLAAQERLTLPHGETEYTTDRGRILVFGGDQVYPTPGEDAYGDRFVGPYHAALPWTDRPHPEVFAIPGNHDWYDGLTAFMRIFCSKEWVGGWRTRQSRSYFAIQLPHHWWLWGVDIQFDHYIDAPQLTFFRDVCRNRVHRGDRIILCTAKPSWVYEGLAGDAPRKSEGATRNLEYFHRTVIRQAGARLMVALSGDLHHYAHYARRDGPQQLITAGGGGAFMHPTHNLPCTLRWPSDTENEASHRYVLEEVFPTEGESKAFRKRTFLAPIKTWQFFLLVAAIQIVLLWTVQYSLRRSGHGVVHALKAADYPTFLGALFRNPAGALLSLILIGGLVGFADATRWWKLALGVPHGVAQVFLSLAVMFGLATLLEPLDWRGAAFLVPYILLVGVAGGIAGCLLMGVYLGSMQILFGRHPTEAYSAQGIADFKNLLRIHLSKEGTLTVYPIGIRRVTRKWRVRRDGQRGDPWIEPDDDPVVARLIERPYSVA